MHYVWTKSLNCIAGWGWRGKWYGELDDDENVWSWLDVDDDGDGGNAAANYFSMLRGHNAQNPRALPSQVNQHEGRPKQQQRRQLLKQLHFALYLEHFSFLVSMLLRFS